MAIAVAVVAPTMALADSGDGKIACNTGEICFARDDASVRYQKHFWYGASHDNFYFCDTVESDADGSELKNNAEQVRNRDRTCDVKVIDVAFARDWVRCAKVVDFSVRLEALQAGPRSEIAARHQVEIGRLAQDAEHQMDELAGLLVAQ